MPYKRKPRLRNFDYLGCHRYFITICTDQKLPLLEDSERVNEAIDVLAEKSREHGFTVWGYCFMPDHLHLLLEGEREDSDMQAFVRVFKQKTGYRYRSETTAARKLWQPGYYDRVLRRDEDLQEVLKYIFNNPVRKGLVGHYGDYRYLGSLALDVKTVTF